MRASLTVLTEELRRLKAHGLKSVVVPVESLERLRAAVTILAARNPAAQTSAAVVAPEPEAATAAYVPPPKSAVPKPAAAPVRTLPPPPTVTLPAGDKASQWAWLKQQVSDDAVCREKIGSDGRLVFGQGSLEARVFFCGEAPGLEEEAQGEPFVGPAGDLLTKMIGAMGLKREAVYVGHIVNWRPQLPDDSGMAPLGSRPPSSDEMAYCLPFLRAQLAVVRPTVIVALGATAAKGLLGENAFKQLGEVRGQWREFADVPVIVTYHPSYILRNGSNRSKRAIWEDLLQVMERVELPISEKQRGYFL